MPATRDPLDEQTFVVNTINFLQQQQEWKDTAVIIAYDDSDGWYDHQMSPITNQSTTADDALTDHGACGNGAWALPGIAQRHPSCAGSLRLRPSPAVAGDFSVGEEQFRRSHADGSKLDHARDRRQLARWRANWRRFVRHYRGFSLEPVRFQPISLREVVSQSDDRRADLLVIDFRPRQPRARVQSGARPLNFCYLPPTRGGARRRRLYFADFDPVAVELRISRRQFLKQTGMAGAAMLLPLSAYAHEMAAAIPATPAIDASILAPFVDPLPIPVVLPHRELRPSPANSRLMIPYYRIAMRECAQKLHRDLKPTRMWGYGGSVPGPLIETAQWQTAAGRMGQPSAGEALPADRLHGCTAPKPGSPTSARSSTFMARRRRPKATAIPRTGTCRENRRPTTIPTISTPRCSGITTTRWALTG